MTDISDIFKERVTAITLWGLPWVIVTLTFLLFHNQLYLKSLLDNDTIGIVSVICVFYIVSSFYSFKGFVLPLFRKKKLYAYNKIEVPLFSNEYSNTAEKILEKYNGDTDVLNLYVAIIVIRDFLLQYKENKNSKDVSSYIPSQGQIKVYPYDSLRMMLSFQEKLKEIDTDKYYNFELILKTCLLDGE